MCACVCVRARTCVTHHLPALLLFVGVLQLSVHYPAHRQTHRQNQNPELSEPHQVQTAALLLRVRRLPDAAQFVGLHGSVAGQLQQPLDVVEDGGLVVGQRKLHLPGRTQARHLNTHTPFISDFYNRQVFLWYNYKLSYFELQRPDSTGLCDNFSCSGVVVVVLLPSG